MDSVLLLHRPWFFSRDNFRVLVGDFELVMSRGHRLEWLALHVCAWKAGPKPSLKDDQYTWLFWESESVQASVFHSPQGGGATSMTE